MFRKKILLPIAKFWIRFYQWLMITVNEGSDTADVENIHNRVLTLFLPMFPFDPSENIKKPKVF